MAHGSASGGERGERTVTGILTATASDSDGVRQRRRPTATASDSDGVRQRRRLAATASDSDGI
jgi:hypothetical protein